MMILLGKILKNTIMNDLDHTVYLISLVTKEEALTSIELEHLSDMLVRLSNEFPQS